MDRKRPPPYRARAMSDDGPPPTCRFAPSPNGALHLGHAYSALRNAAVAARLGGRLLLRVENIDIVRCSPERERAIEDDLRWLGLRWDGPVRRQSERFAAYGAALEALAGRGLLYPCFCTRGDIARVADGNGPRDPDGAALYPGTCRDLSPRQRRDRVGSGTPFSLRLDMGRALALADASCDWTEFGEGEAGYRIAGHPAAWGDAVLRRKDIPASYHVAVVVDDADQGVTDVVRGRDLFAATGLHRLLQTLLDLPEPRYHHHRLVLDAVGEKLAKSRGAPPLADLRRAGATPADAVRLIGERLEPPPYANAASEGS